MWVIPALKNQQVNAKRRQKSIWRIRKRPIMSVDQLCLKKTLWRLWTVQSQYYPPVSNLVMTFIFKLRCKNVLARIVIRPVTHITFYTDLKFEGLNPTTIGRLSADLMHCCTQLQIIKEATSSVQSLLQNFIDLLAKL